MRRFIKIILILLVLLIAAAVAVPFVVPADKIKEEILAQIEAKTGREVSIDKVSFTLFPTIGLSAEGVKISNPTWAGDGNMAEIKTLKVGLELMPLLHHEYKLKELTLDEPVIVLIQQKGRANWEFGPATAQETPQAKAAPETSTEGKTDKTLALLKNLHLDHIAVKDGSFTFRNEVTHETQSMAGVNFSLKAPDLSERAELTFSTTYGGKNGKLDLTVEKPLALTIGSLADINLKASYGPLDITWVGQAAFRNNHKPILNGKVSIPSIDTADFASKDSKKGEAAASANTPRPEGAAHWSTDPIKLDGLNAADLDLNISIGSLKTPKATLSDVNAAVRLNNGTLNVQVNPIKAYGGTITLALSANATGGVGGSFSAAGAQAEPLLHDFAGFDRISGTIELNTKFTASGGSQRAMIQSLGGSGSVAFKNGKLKGVNLAALIRNVTGGQGEETATDFSELSGTFKILRGVVTNDDFKMNSPLLRVTGAGTADLPNWEEHFLLKPTLVASLEGQGGKSAGGITIPVKVEGPLDRPHYQPDLASALQDNLKDPAKLKDTVNGLKDQLKGGGLKNLLR